ncbi:MAG: PHP domain-containing protein [Bacteroidales bacterium]|jgi:PHP family Zn ribbon phosphoesterase|nr:PHP domain-containing protein [Bacteroidales bacterium]
MQLYKADFHTHTVLSPCGDLDMSPQEIIRLAKERNLDIIGITDHNTTKHGRLTRHYGEQSGIFVLTGAEVTTKEEAHCLAFFEKDQELDEFERFLQENLPDIPNDTEKFGYQVQVDEKGDIIYQEPLFLPSAINKTLEEVEDKVHALNGLFIPAHIDRPKFSIPSQLGFIPFDLNVDAVELSIHSTKADYLSKNSYLQGQTFIQSSDAHYPCQIATAVCWLLMHSVSFEEIRKTLHKENGRMVFTQEELI